MWNKVMEWWNHIWGQDCEGAKRRKAIRKKIIKEKNEVKKEKGKTKKVK